LGFHIPYSPVREGRPNRIKNARVYKQAAVFLFFSGLPALAFLPGLALLVAQLLNMECFVRQYRWGIILSGFYAIMELAFLKTLLKY